MKFTIRHDHPSLPGHFPNEPIVPGVVILDHVQRAIEAEAGTAKALQMAQVKFLRPLLPDEEADILFEKQAEAYVFRVTREDVTLVSGQMVLA